MSVYIRLIKNPLIATISNHIDGYPTPINLSYLWGFGSLAGIALGVQIVTGVLLAMHYAPEIHLAFSSVEHIMRDVRGGVALRYIHANGASMFFIVVYIHMFRGLYYGSYFQPRANLWYSGIVIFILMMATAFMGYVLPWGQMSFWGATVITNLFSAIPGLGDTIVQTLWGGFSVDNPTLNRFFSLHYFMPFVTAAVAFLHLILLHQPGSNNPLGITAIYDRVPFYPYFYVKDLFGFFMFVWIFSMFVIYAPNYMGHPDNYIEANPLVTPAHIVPEWYFLPFYAVLRTISDKLGGVILMGLAIVILALLPIVDTSVFRSNFFKPLNVIVFWFFFVNSFALGWIGQEIVESPFTEMSNFVTLFYFMYFLVVLPIAGFLEYTIFNKYIVKPSLSNSYNTYGFDGSNIIGLVSCIFVITTCIGLGIYMFKKDMGTQTDDLLSVRSEFSTHTVSPDDPTVPLLVPRLMSQPHISTVEGSSSETRIPYYWAAEVEFPDVKAAQVSRNIARCKHKIVNQMFARAERTKDLPSWNESKPNLTKAVPGQLSARVDKIKNLPGRNESVYQPNLKKAVPEVPTFTEDLVAVINNPIFWTIVVILGAVGYYIWYVDTDASKNSTDASNISTEESKISIEASKNSTDALNITTEASKNSTDALNITTEASKNSTDALNITTEASKNSTEESNISTDVATSADLVKDRVDAIRLIEKSDLLKNTIECQEVPKSTFVSDMVGVMTNSNILGSIVILGAIGCYIWYANTKVSNIRIEESKIRTDVATSADLVKDRRDAIRLMEKSDLLKNTIECQEVPKSTFVSDMVGVMTNPIILGSIVILGAIGYYIWYADTKASKNSTDASNISTEASKNSTDALNITTEASKNSTDALNITTEALNISTNGATSIQIPRTNVGAGAVRYLEIPEIKNVVEKNSDSSSSVSSISPGRYGEKSPYKLSETMLDKDKPWVKERSDFSLEFVDTEDIFAKKPKRTLNTVFEEVPDFIDFNIFFSWLYILQFVFLGVFLLFIIIYFPKNSKATMTLNRLISIIVIYTLWDIKLGTLIRFQENTNNLLEHIQVNQENSLYFNLFIFYAILIIFLFFFGVIDRFFIANSGDMEFTILICFIVVGSLLVFKVHNFLDVILALEVITLASYVLVSFEKKNRFSTYAGVQYFVLGSLPSGMLVLGSAMLYENWGTLVIEDLDVLLSKIYILNFENSVFDLYKSSIDYICNMKVLSNDIHNLYLNISDKDLFLNNKEFLYIKSKNNILTFGTIIGFGLILFNFLFKITSAPFHVWAPSIYGKAPIATVTFLSIFSKAMIFFFMFKVLSTFSFGYSIIVTLFLLFCGFMSILFGMVGAFTEKFIKRFFVYSSMSHVGFMLIGFALSNLEGVSATFHYLPVYILSSFIMWFILLTMGRENKILTQFKWLINTDMMTTLIFSFLLFSMSGIPPLGGFFIKLDILLVLLESSRFYLNYILFIFSVASFFYYLRLIKIMFFDGDNTYYKKKERSNERLWIISVLFIILLFYTIIVQKPLLVIQKELLSTLY